MKPMDKLKEMASYSGERQTVGLGSEVLNRFLPLDPSLGAAIEAAYAEHKRLRETEGELLAKAEAEQIRELQADFVNFYDPLAVNPYVALAAAGPWVVTSCGAVVHDSGGYGMLGLGHAPQPVIEAMARKHVMANIMTASFAQKRFVTALRREIGHSRLGSQRHPFARFLCLNSGSEAMTLALRIADINARRQTDAGGRHASKKTMFLSLKGSFHGRTDRPSQLSDASLKVYREHLASFRGRDNLLTIPPNDTAALAAVYAEALKQQIFIEAMLVEPVMGEGNPGMAMTVEFYRLARRLTTEHGSLLIVDSIQAGLRSHGCLSLMDYPGFSEVAPPDMETFSKAVNAGQYPFSVVALREGVADLYVSGVYGNTMTANPRALEVATAVLEQVDGKLRDNIQARGREFLTKLRSLADEFPRLITKVQGTGLLFSVGIDPAKAKVVGAQGLEWILRQRGLGVIHGGENALRFTPHFRITTAEIDMMLGLIRQVFTELGHR